MENTTGLLEDNLKIIRPISSGAYGTVFEVLDSSSQKRFAQKLIKTNHNLTESSIMKEIGFLEEINKLSKKPQIFPSFYGFIKKTDAKNDKIEFLLFFDLLKETLSEFIEKSYPLTFSQIKDYFSSLINGLAFLQTLNICHRDLKPHNILLNHENQLILVDFGISKKIDYSTNYEEMTVIGTENYFSPELYQAENEETTLLNPFKSDVFSLGLIFLKIGLKEAPFRNSKKNKNMSSKEYEEEIKKEINRFYDFYKNQIDDVNDEKELINIRKCLKKMMKVKFEKRCDFLELFTKSIKIWKVEDLRKIILMQDRKKDLLKKDIDEEKTLIKKNQFHFPNSEVKEIKKEKNPENISSIFFKKSIICLNLDLIEALENLKNNQRFSDENYQNFFKENIELLKMKKQTILLMGDKVPVLNFANKLIFNNTNGEFNNLIIDEIHDSSSRITIIEGKIGEKITLENENGQLFNFENISEFQNHFYKNLLNKLKSNEKTKLLIKIN